MAYIGRESLRVLFVAGTAILPIIYWLLGRVDRGARRQIRKKAKEGANSESHGEKQRAGTPVNLEPLGKRCKQGADPKYVHERAS
jgi:hypothetical protein